MKCHNCNAHIGAEDIFCQNCGVELKGKKEKEMEKNGFVDHIDDVLFTPNKKNQANSSGINWLMVLLVIAALFFFYSVYKYYYAPVLSTNQTTPSEATPTPQNNGIFPVEELNIENKTLDWVGQNLYFKGTLKNNFSSPVQNVVVRLDLYNDQTMNSLFDTRFVTLAGATSYGAYTFSEYVNVSLISHQFWWTSNIERASYY